MTPATLGTIRRLRAKSARAYRRMLNAPTAKRSGAHAGRQLRWSARLERLGQSPVLTEAELFQTREGNAVAPALPRHRPVRPDRPA